MKDYIFWLLIIGYCGHILEEYVFDWNQWVYTITGITLSTADFLVTNGILIVTGFCLSFIGEKELRLSLALPSLLLINALVHIIPTIVRRVYSPGVITSFAIFIPLSLLTFHIFIDELRLAIVMYAFLGGFGLMMYPVVLQITKTKYFVK